MWGVVVLVVVLCRDLTERGLWTPEVRNQIIADQGSVQNVRQIPQELKDLYKTVWEIKQKFILNQVRTLARFLRPGSRRSEDRFRAAVAVAVV